MVVDVLMQLEGDKKKISELSKNKFNFLLLQLLSICPQEY